MRLLAYPILMIISSTVVFSPFIWFNLQANPITEPPKFLESYLLVGFIIQGIITFLLTDMMYKKRESQNKKEAHSLDLNEIYKRLCYVGCQNWNSPNRSRVQLTFPRNFYISSTPRSLSTDRFARVLANATSDSIHYETINFDELHRHPDYQYFEFAIEHLKDKKYEKIYIHWKKAWDIIDSYNEGSKTGMDELNAELKLFANELESLIMRLKSGKQIESKCSACP